MPYQVGQLIKGKGQPVSVTRDEIVAKALSLMIEHDYSQLPVIEQDHGMDIPVGMITYEGILRGVRNFRAELGELKVRDVMVDAPIYSIEDDLFFILDRLKETNAVLVTDSHTPHLLGIVTSYDTTEYFRNRTEDFMRVEEIEGMVKEFIRVAYTDEGGELNEAKLKAAIARVVPNASKDGAGTDKVLTFDELTLHDYNNLLLMADTWPTLEPILGVKRDYARPLLTGIRDTRNALAHFRADDITPEQRDQLKFGAEWLTHRQQEYQAGLEARRNRDLQERIQRGEVQFVPVTTEPATVPIPADAREQPNVPDYSVSEAETGGGRWAVFADWLQSQPGRLDDIPLTFNEIEEITKAMLPASAREQRAWWANDSVSHSQSRQWLAAGWRTTYVNLTEGRVTFSRIRERERAYIDFYSKLLQDLRSSGGIPVRNVSPDGASWIVIHTLPRQGGQHGGFNYSFSRDKRFRVELYLDLWDQDKTKAVFDQLHSQKDKFEAQVGPIEWERLDSRRASRLAIYHDGQITDSDRQHAVLRKWAVETMNKLYQALASETEKAILEVKNR